MTVKEYNECVNQYADHVYRFIVKNLRHTEDARDVVQSSFEKMWIKRETIDPEKAKSFLFTVAYRQMIDHIRRQSKLSFPETVQEPADHASYQTPNRKRILDEALSRLNETQRSLVMLKDYEGYSYAEIGEITGLNESQVKVYLHRARLQLKAYIIHPENVV